MAKKRPSTSRTAGQLAGWIDRHSEFGKKFVVVIYGERERQDFRLFRSERQALFLFFNAAYACLTKTKVRDAQDDFVEISGARIYQVDCDDEELARDRIARGNALRLHDTSDLYARRELIVQWLFRCVQ